VLTDIAPDRRRRRDGQSGSIEPDSRVDPVNEMNDNEPKEQNACRNVCLEFAKSK
jgi:hypothetical protein